MSSLVPPTLTPTYLGTSSVEPHRHPFSARSGVGDIGRVVLLERGGSGAPAPTAEAALRHVAEQCSALSCALMEHGSR